MAKVTLNNGDSGGTIRTAINNMFTELYKLITGGTAGGQTIIGGSLTTQSLTLQPNGADTTTGQVIVGATTAATSKTDGSLKVLGGASIGGAIVGGALTVDSAVIGSLAGVLKGASGTISASATTADLPDSSDKRYVTDAELLAIATMNSMGGIPFRKTAKLTSAAAATPVHIITDAEVPTGMKVHITDCTFKVNGATAWTDGTATKVIIQDTAAVLGLDVAKSLLTGNATVDLTQNGVILGSDVITDAGLTANKGIDIVADAIFANGSDLYVTVTGTLA